MLAWPVPRLLARATALRRVPRPALVLWQSTALAAVVAALFTAPAAVLGLVAGPSRVDSVWPVLLAAAVSGSVAARLALSGDRVGRGLRASRRRQRELVDLLATPDITDAVDPEQARRDRLRVLAAETPTAYCVPGLQHRVVVTRGAVESLAPVELDAVLAHERAHLVARHDLVLEFFTVAHEAVPAFVRCESALRSVTLLIEVLADRAAVKAVGVVPTARAIVAMVGAGRPDGTLGMTDTAADAAVRIGLLEGGPVVGLPPRVAAGLVYLAAALVLALPVALLTVAWSAELA
ncbi:Zn-dependent protease with chaperone function [Terracoccus luteus]|uniref:Zn-dependent protease with chaperone function n=1 Tax=Terracoccus luteus TaxID=53356 RepID=A0A495Y4T7_9MICO|nr:M56 family metallopeptidase [Terracoccus luteus]RKT79988.1 Zn-dependent protease with chaperone function [Terracoccus luteus]